MHKNNELVLLRSEVASLRADICALKQRIGNVRAWIKTGLLIFFLLSALIVIGQYIFTAQIEQLRVETHNIQESTKSMSGTVNNHPLLSVSDIWGCGGRESLLLRRE